MPTAIKFENISKQYRLGLVSTRTLSHDLNRWWQTAIRGKEDPYLTIGSVNDRSTKADSDYVWALRDINFEVEQGDVVGIIGKNGAGKSTLLKILSKVTAPTTGTIKAKGRIASLLEIGTGFHPEMTGRENIYMNGAIMGMTRAEITRKFDEIVDFAGVERYIDTPVKRYSSGMTVRLGFAVAAFLEPEILVVDEVLAVGDAEFQKKAIGKMQNISHGDGRTVLFVSHNMGAIASLCSRAILLQNGSIYEDGTTSDVISNYLNKTNATNINKTRKIQLADGLFEVLDFKISQKGNEADLFQQGYPIECQFQITNNSEEKCNVEFNIEIKTGQGEPVTCFGNEFQNYTIALAPKQKKLINADMHELLLKKGNYFASIYFKISQNKIITDSYIEEALKFEVDNASPLYFLNTEKHWKLFPAGYQHGYVFSKIDNLSEKEI
ncbi:MAG: ABC transporter ATP-binding protein [Microbacter sp.]